MSGLPPTSLGTIQEGGQVQDNTQASGLTGLVQRLASGALPRSMSGSGGSRTTSRFAQRTVTPPSISGTRGVRSPEQQEKDEVQMASGGWSGGWLGRLLCPGRSWRHSSDPSVIFARDAVKYTAWKRALTSLHAAKAHEVMSEELFAKMQEAAAGAAAAQAAAAGGADPEADAQLARHAAARLQAANNMLQELGRVPAKLQDMEMGIHTDVVDLKEFGDAAIMQQGWADWAAFFDVWSKVLAAAATVFAYAAGVYNDHQWIAFVAGILGTVSLALAGLSAYAKKLSDANDEILLKLRTKFRQRAAEASGATVGDAGRGAGGGAGAVAAGAGAGGVAAAATSSDPEAAAAGLEEAVAAAAAEEGMVGGDPRLSAARAD